MKLQEKVAIVTGGGSGIGEAICRRMAREGASVIIADIDLVRADNVAKEIREGHSRAIAVQLDVTKSAEANQVVEAVIKDFGKLDILVNNAGVSHPNVNVPFSQSTEEMWDWTIAVNLKGVRNCTRAAINHMIERKYGKIVNIASIAGIRGTITKADYSAAKGGVIGFTKALAKEVAPYGINVNSVLPGPTATPLFLSNTKEKQEYFVQGTYLKRAAKPEEIANMVVFLASDEAGFAVGQNFIIDGGKSL